MYARAYFDDKGDANIDFKWGRADQLSKFQDDSFDIVFTDAVLMFVTPNKIGKVLAELAHVARRGIALNEYHKDGEFSGFFARGRGVYDFLALLSQYIPKADVHKTRSAFTGGAWDEHGQLIEVNL